MNLLIPAFLAGLAALSIPVILHLMQRPIPRRLVFPTIRFILKGQQFQAGKKGLRDPLTLLCRLLLLACIVMIFAGPFLLNKDVIVADKDTQRVLILADVSASLTATDFDAFTDRTAERLATAFPKAQFSLIASSNRVVRAVPFSNDQSAVLKQLRELKPEDARGDHRDAIMQARETISSAPGPVHLVIVSDLQQQDWSDLALPVENLAGPPRVERPWENAPGNIAILNVSPELFANGEEKQLRATVLVRNYSLTATEATLTLRAGPQSVTKVVQLAPEASIKYVLDLPNPGSNIGVAEIAGDDSYALDNVYHFWLGRRPPPKIAIVADEKDRTHTMETFFLRQALLTTAPGVDPVELSLAKPEFIMEVELTPYDMLIFLDSMGDYSLVEHDILLGYLEEGGNALYVPGNRTAETFLSLNRAQVVTTRFTGYKGDLNQMSTYFIESFDAQVPLMAPFAQQPADLLNIPIYRLVTYQPAATAVSPIMAGDGIPFLIDEPVGKGRMYMLATALAPKWSELPTSMSFLPLIRQFITAGVGAQDRRIAHLEVGQPTEASLEAAGIPGTAPVDIQPGVQVIEGIPVEVNYTRAESDLRPAERLASLGTLETGSNTASAASSSEGMDNQQRVPLRPLLGWLLLGLLCLELVVANYRIT